MRRETLERHQVWFYLTAVSVGLGLGTLAPQLGSTADPLLWPVLAPLLYATFTQVPMAAVPAAFTEGRFMATALLGNFVLLPAVVWALIQFIPDSQPLQLGLLLPLGLAVLTEVWAARSRTGAVVVLHLGWWPVPLLAVVVLLVAVAHVGSVLSDAHLLPVVLGVVILFLAISLLLSRSIASAARLNLTQGRTLAFSMGTRNSFIVLPLALALPTGWETVAIVVVMQSLVELFGMIFCLWFIPRVLFPDPRPSRGEKPPSVR